MPAPLIERTSDMKCYSHPELEAVAACTTCGKALCESCSIDVGGRISCQQCLSERPTRRGTGSLGQMSPLTLVSVLLGAVGILGLLCGGYIGGLLFGFSAVVTGWMSHKGTLEAHLQRPAVSREVLKSLAGRTPELAATEVDGGDMTLSRAGFWLGAVEAGLSTSLAILSLLALGAYCGLCSLSGLCDSVSR
jgi:hypothetical protein